MIELNEMVSGVAKPGDDNGADVFDDTLWNDAAFVARARELAQAKGKKPREVCKAAGLAPDYLNKAAGRAGRGTRYLAQLARELDVSLVDFLKAGEPIRPATVPRRLLVVADIEAPLSEKLLSEILQIVGKAA